MAFENFPWSINLFTRRNGSECGDLDISESFFDVLG